MTDLLLNDEQLDEAWPDETTQCDTVEEILYRGIIEGSRAIAKNQALHLTQKIKERLDDILHSEGYAPERTELCLLDTDWDKFWAEIEKEIKDGRSI